MFFARFRQYNYPLLMLALPLLGAHLAQTGMSVVDTLMAGRLSATDLAAVAVGSSVFMPLMLLIFGTLLATTPLVAQAAGAGRTDNLSGTVHQASWVALVMLVPGALILFYSRLVFDFMGVSDEVASLAAGYLHALIWGLPALAFFQVLRCMCEGLNHARPVLLISLAGLLLNIPANYVLIYGKLGFPQLGAIGCGYATALSFWFMALLLSVYVHWHHRYRAFGIFARLQTPKWPDIAHILWVGLPIGLSIFVEASLFTTITLFIGGLGEITVAGHQVAINFTTLLFMVPLSLGMALTVKVGHAVGAGQAEEARRIAFYGVGFSLLVSMLAAAFMWFSAPGVVRLYSENTEVQLLAAALIQLAVLYQISDALQVNAAGALRGYKDTRIIMLITLFSYWLIGLGGGWWLAMGSNPWGPLGVHGFWYGLIMGLTFAAVLLLWRLHHTSRRF
ncbi:MATE family efflux transporter [Marinospirillum alkaliphilum]|uniref:Multidrug-efflux transporter n=1 Tax=Marinospirillum alkaliphilum DSM 21637 TaxID=1122209 RepID=A0A1K1WY20_9GAMM|nr:MATE family efflux transporter [Marinospirillum alkaliphilum]SFX42329.1 multidrug resistance protein, MATE family [Marinospirillum alkaliphilum DSM 21637]